MDYSNLFSCNDVTVLRAALVLIGRDILVCERELELMVPVEWSPFLRPRESLVWRPPVTVTLNTRMWLIRVLIEKLKHDKEVIYKRLEDVVCSN
jgi:hypothetical protein